MVDRQQVEIDAVEETIPLIPAVAEDRGLERLGVRPVRLRDPVLDEAVRELSRRLELLEHQAVEENRAGAPRRAKERTRIVVHADREVVLPGMPRAAYIDR
jgi:hypothetical protein